MSFEHPDGRIAIRARGLGKCYEIYSRPQDRLRQILSRGRKKYYREFWALRHVTLEIQRGETVGIIGRNGAGKTTLLQLIAGTLAPTEGEAQSQGRVTALLELGSGFNPEFTGRENVFLNGSILGVSRREMEQRFDRVASFADIGDFIDQPVKIYSRGMTVRLAFAVMANLDPEIFLVDEALAVGDIYFRHRCMLRFHEMKENGTTILYVSHDAGSMKRLCDRVVWLDNGLVRQDGPPSEVVDRYIAELFKRPVVQTTKRNAEAPKPPAKRREPRGLKGEDTIPNIDRRLGDQKCSLVGVALYDSSLRPINVAEHNNQVILRVTIRNNLLPAGTRSWLAGYVLRNARGVEIASTNSAAESVDLPIPPRGQTLTLQFKIILPRLYPGSYSFSPAVAYTTPAGDEIMGDWIDNALVFELTGSRKVHVMMALDTEVEVEPRWQNPNCRTSTGPESVTDQHVT